MYYLSLTKSDKYTLGYYKYCVGNPYNCQEDYKTNCYLVIQ